MTEDQITAWLAGLFDGEGCITVQLDRDQSLDIRVKIANTNYELLYCIKERLGYGTVSEKGDRWECTRANAEKFLTRVKPFVIVKKDDMRIAEALFSTVGKVNKKETKDWARWVLVRHALIERWKLHRITQKSTRAARHLEIDSAETS